jgi:hypothetical protein
MIYSKQAVPTTPDATQKHDPKINLKSKSRQKIPLTTQGYEPYYTKKEKRQDGAEKITISHASGPIPGHTQLKPSFMNPMANYDEDIIHNWVPHMSLSVVDDNTGSPLSAAEIDAKRHLDWIPHYFTNPMQDLDYLTIEALCRFTITGPIMDGVVKFLVGQGFKPELELVNPSGNKDRDQKEIEENQDVIDALVQVDNQLSQNSSDYIDVPFTEKVAAMISSMQIFNRGALVFGYDTSIEIDGKKYKAIPSSVKFAHARDLGIIEVEPSTWRLKSVQWRNAFYMVPSRNMIYLWNPLLSAKTRGSWLYGDSSIMPMIDSSRVIRKNIGVNFPAMAEATWAGLFLMAVKPQGQTAEQKRKEYQEIVQNMVRGGPNVLMEHPDDVKFQDVDFNPKVNEFKDLTESLIKYNVACIGLPHALFYDEAAANRSTMIEKIQLATAVTINPIRSMIGRQFSDQWYQRWFKLICKEKNKMDLYKKFRIKTVFSDLHIGEWFDKIESINKIMEHYTLTPEAYGEMAGIESFVNKIDQNAGPPEKSFKFGDEKNGFEIRKTQGRK